LFCLSQGLLHRHRSFGTSPKPPRNPLDAFSDGRLTYGVGAGRLREEAGAMGMPWDRRGARSEEHVSLLRTL